MSPATILALAPIFKDTVTKAADTLAGGMADCMKSYGRGAENIMGAVADRIRGPHKPNL